MRSEANQRVAGYVSAVLVQDHQPVRAGQVLARIDDRDFRTPAPAGATG
jgi:membrane fusion protein, multidrug efflux system